MKPLGLLDARAVRFVLLDIDDTLTTRGKLGAQAYGALEALQRAGKKVIPVTGRPAGWCDHLARMWPVDAVVGENGAFYFWFAEGKLGKRFIDDEPTRARQRRELQKLAKSILRQVPGAALASDQPYRETDLAIDYCEDVPPLSPAGRGTHRHAHARRRPERQGELDPRQWMVRALRQARHRAQALHRALRRRSRRRERATWSMPGIRRTTRRCSAFSTIRSAWRTCAAFRICSRST